MKIIGESAFAYNQLTNLKIPNTVTLIGDYAFSDNQLTSVSTGKNVITIGAGAFEENQLASVEFPDSVQKIFFSGDDRSFDYLPMITISSNSNLNTNSLTSLLGMEDEEDFIGQLIIKEGNEAPVELELLTTSFDENIAINSVVSSFKTTDPNPGDTFSYSLVSVINDADNDNFIIDNNQLILKHSPDFESKNTYSIRLRATDANNLWVENSFILNVNDINEKPVDMFISANSINENIAIGSKIAELRSADNDTNDTFTYSLIEGGGGDDNKHFVISGNNLKTRKSVDFETKPYYSIRLQTKDSGGLGFDKSFILIVNDLIDTPTAESESSSTTELASKPKSFEPPTTGETVAGSNKDDNLRV